MKININKLLAYAEKAYKNGQYEESKKVYEEIIKVYPNSSQANKGLLRLEKVINNDRIQKNLTQEQINSVVSLYKNGQFQEAVDLIKTLNKSHPNVPLLFNLLGACYKSLGQIDHALKMFETATKIKPDYAEAFFNQGVILKGVERLKDAVAIYKKAISLNPNYPDAHNNLGNTYKDLGMYDEAIKSYECALAYKPDFEVVHLNLGLIYSKFDQESAIKYFKKAIEHKPDYSEAYYNLGSTLMQLGKKNESIKSYEKAIEIKPDYVAAHKNLSAMKLYQKNDPQIMQILSLLKNKLLNDQDRIALNFTLAKVNEDLENKDDFFKYLIEGNNLRKKELGYSVSKDLEKIDKIKEIFINANFQTDKFLKNRSSISPIFILGMPRSGTSLVEQIISSHKEVFGAGELQFIARYSNEELKSHYMESRSVFSVDSFSSIRNKYLDSLAKISTDKKIITDKMPLNFLYIGFILSSFPDAKIIHIKRDAIATCWSIYKYNFQSDGNGYSHNMEDLCTYYSKYFGLMGFWRDLYPNQIYDISYEDLTSNQEVETRKLLDYCELQWDENCLNFHKNKRAVKTTSALQVRQKMYQGSSEAWKKYEDYLEPLISGLKSY
jgi:tetratricopeptide (TPR) repeat protein